MICHQPHGNAWKLAKQTPGLSQELQSAISASDLNAISNVKRSLLGQISLLQDCLHSVPKTPLHTTVLTV